MLVCSADSDPPMSSTPSSCFVYGTLKPGERNHKVAEQGGKFTAEEGEIKGFDLFHFHPENYPGILPGEGVVRGYVLTYEDMSVAMPFLDELEGTEFDPPLYTRELVTVSPQNKQVWVYIYGNRDRCFLPTAQRIESGDWQPMSSEEGLYP